MNSLAAWLERANLSGVQPRAYGARANCPFHQDRQRTFAVYLSGRFRCFHASCQTAGHIDRLETYLGTAAPKIVWQEEDTPDFKIIAPYWFAPFPFAHDALAKRGVPSSEVGTWGLRWDNRPHRDALLIPIQDELGQIVSVAWRYNDARKYRHRAGFQKGHVLYGLWRVTGKIVYLVEGFADCWKLWSFGHEAVASMGASVSKAQVQLLKARGIETVVVMYDNDSAGFRGAVHAAEMLIGHADVAFGMHYRGRWPKDPGEADRVAVDRLAKQRVGLDVVLDEAWRRWGIL